MTPEEIRNYKIEALRAAINMKPLPEYAPSGTLGQSQLVKPHYDLLKEAESIYQWLIKKDKP